MAFLIRFNALLIALVLGSAFYLVHVQYQSRRLYTELDRAHNQTRQLQTEHEQLQVEKRAQATSARVQQMAAERLHMRPPHPGITVYVDLPGSAASVERSERQGRP